MDDMITDPELLKEINADFAGRGRRREVIAPVLPQLRKMSEADAKRRVWVKCVVETKPWTEERPLLHWQDYETNYAEAMLLQDRKMAVIIATPKEK